MVRGEFGIKDCDFTNGVAYLAHWLARLRDDKREVFRAAADAQRIADYLLAFHPTYSERIRAAEEAEDAGEVTPNADLAKAA